MEREDLKSILESLLFVADGPVRPVRHVPERAGPIAGLAKQMLPGDRGIVLGREEGGIRRVVPGAIGDVAN